MNYRKTLGLVVLALCLCFTACEKDEDETDGIDPNSLAVGTIMFDINGETIKTTGGDAIRLNDSSLAVGSLIWTEEIGTEVITRNLSLQIYGGDALAEETYDLVWDECSGTNVSCGFIAYITNESANANHYRSEYSDTFLKMNIQKLGDGIGDKVIGTFEARVGVLDDPAGERFDITRGAFNVLID